MQQQPLEKSECTYVDVLFPSATASVEMVHALNDTIHRATSLRCSRIVARDILTRETVVPGSAESEVQATLEEEIEFCWTTAGA